MKYRLALLGCLLPALAFAQGGPIIQSGNLTPGHALMGITNGVAGDAGPALGGSLKELGITATGTPFCIDDAPIASPYHQLCFGANSIGGGLISYDHHGGAAALPLEICTNGVCVQFPFSTSGVVGPNTTFANDVATWGNTSGTLLRDDSPIVAAPITPLGTTPITRSGSTFLATTDRTVTIDSIIGPNVDFDTIQAVAIQPPGSTVVNVEAVAGYAINYNAAALTGQSAVGVFGDGLSKASNSNTWGLVGQVTDTAGLSNQGMFGAELDVNIAGTNTTATGLSITGIWASTPAVAIGLSINKSGASAWTDAILVATGCCTRVAEIGALAATGTSVSGPPILWDFIDSGGVHHDYTMQATPGEFAFSGSQTTPTFGFNGNIALNAGFSLSINGDAQLAHNFLSLLGDEVLANVGHIVTISPGPSITQTNLGSGTQTLGLFVANGGTATKYVCVDAFNVVVIQAGAC
jgi:hypothetical protein